MKFDQLDLNLLRVLVAIHRTGSVTIAGKSLSLSQSATSSALGRLRLHLGDALFVRSPSGLKPTKLCDRLAPEVSEVLQRLEASMSTAEGFEPGITPFRWRITLSDLGEMMFLPPLIGALRRHAPQSRLENVAVAPERLVDALENREIDFSIGTMHPHSRGIRTQALYEDRYVALSSASWRPHGNVSGNRLSMEQLAAAPLAVASPTATFHGGIEKVLTRLKLSDRISLRAQHFVALRDLALNTDLLTIVPLSYARTLEQEGSVRTWELPTEAPASYEVHLVWHECTTQDPPHIWIRDKVLELFGQRPSVYV